MKTVFRRNYPQDQQSNWHMLDHLDGLGAVAVCGVKVPCNIATESLSKVFASTVCEECKAISARREEGK